MGWIVTGHGPNGFVRSCKTEMEAVCWVRIGYRIGCTFVTCARE